MYQLSKIKLKDIKTGPLQDSSLPKGFISRVIKYKGLLSEVETTSLEETILNFQRDYHPKRELKVWEKIAEMYVEGCKNNPDWNFTDKKQYFETLLGLSLGING